jgi:hypothetical protein
MSKGLAIAGAVLLFAATAAFAPSHASASSLRGDAKRPSFACCTVTCGNQTCGACGELFTTCHCSPVDGHAECYGSDGS